MEAETYKNDEKKYIMQTYARFDAVLDHAEGCIVYDVDGKRYIDLIGGIACVPVGHANKQVATALCNQAHALVQASNLYYTKPQILLAAKLSKITGVKKSFFCNSGAEANEAAIKLAKKATGKKEFIVCNGSFHGRTHATLAATSKKMIKEGFEPLVDGFRFAEYGSVDAIEKEINDKTAAVMIEPIQGESGIVIPPNGYLSRLKRLCQKKKALLILDEVQSGNGRTGKFFAYQHERMVPDIVTTAKGLGNGIPIGVCISNLEFGIGQHGSTFGGNCLSCAAACATIEEIYSNDLLSNASRMGEYFAKKLKGLPKVRQVRGKGLMIGIDVDADARQICDRCLTGGLLINNARENTLRLLPPLTISKKEIDEAIGILNWVLLDV